MANLAIRCCKCECDKIKPANSHSFALVYQTLVQKADPHSPRFFLPWY